MRYRHAFADIIYYFYTTLGYKWQEKNFNHLHMEAGGNFAGEHISTGFSVMQKISGTSPSLPSLLKDFILSQHNVGQQQNLQHTGNKLKMILWFYRIHGEIHSRVLAVRYIKVNLFMKILDSLTICIVNVLGKREFLLEPK